MRDRIDGSTLRTDAGCGMSSINLLPIYRVHAATKRRSMVTWAAVITVYTALLVCACAAFRTIVVVDRVASETRVELEAQLRESKDQLRSLTAATRRDEALLRAAAQASDHADWSIVLSLLAKSRGDGVRLEHVSMTPASGQTRGVVWRVTGVGSTRADVTGYVAMLEEYGVFDSVVAVETRARDGDTAREYAFELSCEILAAKPTSEAAKP